MATHLSDKPATKHESFIDAQLERTRRRIRLIDLSAALLGFAAGSLLFLMAVMILDRVFVLSTASRQVCLVLYLVAAGLYLAYTVVRPLTWQVNPHFAARKLEETLDSDRNHVVNWLDLRNQKLPAVIRASLGQRAAKDLTSTDPESAVEATRLYFGGAAAGLAVLALIVLFFLFGATIFRSLLGRAFAPFGQGTIPTRTRIEIVRPQGGDATVTIGNPVAIAANVTGRVPGPRDKDAPRLLYRHDASEPFRQRFLQLDDSTSQWTANVAAVDVGVGFTYKVTAGDAETPEYRITARAAPLISDFLVKYRYRPYTDRPDRTSTDRRIEGLEGTLVTLTVRTNRVVTTGTMKLDRGQAINSQPVEGEPQAMRFAFTLRASDEYQIEFSTNEGERYAESASFPILVVPDNPPTVRLTEPAKDVELPANGHLELKGEANDDIGIAKMTLLLTLDGKPIASRPYLADKFGKPGYGTPRFVEYSHLLELATLLDESGKAVALKPGNVVEYQLLAADACDVREPPASTVSEPRYKITIVEKQMDEAKQKKERDEAKKRQQEREKNQEKKLEEQEKKRQEQKQKEEQQEQADADKRDQEKQKGKGAGKDEKKDDKGGEGAGDRKDEEKNGRDEKTRQEAERIQKETEKKGEGEKGEKNEKPDRGEGKGADDKAKDGKGEGKGAEDKAKDGKEGGKPGESGMGKGEDSKGGEGKPGQGSKQDGKKGDQGGGEAKDPPKGGEAGKAGESKGDGKGQPGKEKGEKKPTDGPRPGDDVREGKGKPSDTEGKPVEDGKPGQSPPKSEGKPGESKDGKAGEKGSDARKGERDKGGQSGESKPPPPKNEAPGKGKGTPNVKDATPEDVKQIADALPKWPSQKMRQMAADALGDIAQNGNEQASAAAKQALEDAKKKGDLDKNGQAPPKAGDKDADQGEDGQGSGKPGENSKKSDEEGPGQPGKAKGQEDEPQGNNPGQGGGEKARKDSNGSGGGADELPVRKDRPKPSRASQMQLEKFQKLDDDALKRLKLTREQYEKFLRDYADLAKRDSKGEREVLPGPSKGGSLPNAGGKTIAPTGQNKDGLKGEGRPKPPPGYRDQYNELLRRMNEPKR